MHPGLNSYSRLEDHYNIEREGHYSGQGTLVYRQLRDENDARFPEFRGLSAQWDEGAEYVAVYPNVLLGVQRDHAFAIVLQPVDQENTVEQLVIFLPALFLFAIYASEAGAAALGVVLILGRALYAYAYVHDPAKRGPGFALTLGANVILVVGTIVGATIGLF